MNRTQTRKPDYSNLPSRVDFCFLIAAIILFILAFRYHMQYGETYFIIMMVLTEFFLLCFAFLAYLNTVGAQKVCNIMVAEASKVLRGSEQILDVGTGSGMLLINLAKLLRHGGRAYGVDVWESTAERRAHDRSLRTQQLALSNAAIEGVSDRVSVIGGDPRNLPYKTECFDLVVSMKLFHHMSRGSVDRTLIQMVRVLKNGGFIFIHDFWHLHRIRAQLTRFGLQEIKVVRSIPFLPISRFVVFQKPVGGLPLTLNQLDSVRKAESRKNAVAQAAGVQLASITAEEAARLQSLRDSQK